MNPIYAPNQCACCAWAWPERVQTVSRKDTREARVDIDINTSSAMTIALRKLGYTPYHGSECFKNPPRDFNLWIEAMECNFFNDNPGKKPPYGVDEFDRLLGSYDAVLDIPACLFWEDLVTAYPDAKVILTTRDVEKWHKSAKDTVFKFVQIPFFRFWHRMDSKLLGPLFRESELVWKIFCGNNYEEVVVKQAYLDHYEKIRTAIPKDRLLEFETGKSGWKELCEFLDEPVPDDEPWPKAYPTAEFQNHIDLAMEGAIYTIVKWTGLGLAVGVGVLLLRKNWSIMLAR